MKMKHDEAENIVKRLEVFAKLERKATDEAGWIALAYGCSRIRAMQMIDKARKVIREATS